jgi:hypothetical protein
MRQISSQWQCQTLHAPSFQLDIEFNLEWGTLVMFYTSRSHYSSGSCAPCRGQCQWRRPNLCPVGSLKQGIWLLWCVFVPVFRVQRYCNMGAQMLFCYNLLGHVNVKRRITVSATLTPAKDSMWFLPGAAACPTSEQGNTDPLWRGQI